MAGKNHEAKKMATTDRGVELLRVFKPHAVCQRIEAGPVKLAIDINDWGFVAQCGLILRSRRYG
jgi:hypothetical protein